MQDTVILVINLDRSVERLERIAARLDSLGLAWQRVPAVEGAKLTAQERAECFDEALYHRRHGMTVIPGELGCYLSHVRAMRLFLQGTARYAVILEDDALVTERLPRVLQALAACPEQWDMVKLSAVHSGTPVAVRQLDEEHGLCVMLSRCTGSSAYLINRRAAQAYESGLLPISLPYDHEFDKGWHYGLKVRLASPTPVLHDEHIASTIASNSGVASTSEHQTPANSAQASATAVPKTSRKFHWTRRWPTYAYRLSNEVRRLIYGLGQIMDSRLGA